MFLSQLFFSEYKEMILGTLATAYRNTYFSPTATFLVLAAGNLPAKEE
jgi:hypothetical protein